MEHFAIINAQGKTIATASSMEIVDKYFDDVKNHSNYKKRKRALELERRRLCVGILLESRIDDLPLHRMVHLRNSI